MKEIKTFEDCAKGRISLENAGINRTLYWAYRTSKEDCHNDLIDFHEEVIMERETKEIADALRAEGITEFTISAPFTNLIDVLSAFQEQGVYVNGMAMVNARFTDYETGKNARIHAIKMEVR